MVGMTMSAFAIIVIVQVVQRIVDAVQCGKSIQQFGAPVTRKFLSAFGKGYPHGIFIFGTISCDAIFYGLIYIGHILGDAGTQW